MSDRDEDTPPSHFAMTHNTDAILLAMQTVLTEVKKLGKQMDGMALTLHTHVTDIAVAKVQFAALGREVQILLSRVDALEKERDELQRSVLAKAIALVLLLCGAGGTIIAYFTQRGSP